MCQHSKKSKPGKEMDKIKFVFGMETNRKKQKRNHYSPKNTGCAVDRGASPFIDAGTGNP